VKVDVKMTGIGGVINLLQSLPPEVVSKRGGPVRAALRKGAAVIFKEAQANLQSATAGDDSSGLLLKNLVITRGKAPTDGKGERYLVRVRNKSYGRGDATTLKSAQLLEYGSSKQTAEPWLRPAFQARAEQAIHTVETELVKSLDRIVKKLSKARA
jgi:HK97 gp10 family phage protein